VPVIKGGGSWAVAVGEGTAGVAVTGGPCGRDATHPANIINASEIRTIHRIMVCQYHSLPENPYRLPKLHKYSKYNGKCSIIDFQVLQTSFRTTEIKTAVIAIKRV
jgi:hypothetical protein